MKKGLFFGVCMVALSTGVFAFEMPKFTMSAGGGLLMPEQDFGGGADIGGMALGRNGTERTGFGAVVFFDATYAELSVAYFGGKGTSNWGNFANEPIHFGALNFALLGKFPFNMGSNDGFQWALFPLAGIEYQLMLYQADKTDGIPNAGDHSALWVRFGAGVDISPTDRAYCRIEALGGIRLASAYDNNTVNAFNDSGIFVNEAKYNLGFGYQVKILVGYKFFGL